MTDDNSEIKKMLEVVNDSIWLADYDLSGTNVLETVLEFNDEEIEAVVIDIWIPFPFPDVCGISVMVDAGEEDVDLISCVPIDNLVNWSERLNHWLKEENRCDRSQ